MSVVTVIVWVVLAVVIIAGIIIIYSIFTKPPCSTPGAVRDLTLGHCFLCPKGMHRSLFTAATASNACVTDCAQAYPNAPRPTGSFPDLGKCWHCPENYIRTAKPIYDDKACEPTSGDCNEVLGPGSFKLGETCYKCPPFTKENVLEAVTSQTKCSGDCPTLYPGSIFDGIGGGTCWQCPSGYTRTWDAVDSATACHTGWLGQTARATKVGTPHRPIQSSTNATFFVKAVEDGPHWAPAATVD